MSGTGVEADPSRLSRVLRSADFTVQKTLLASETDLADLVRVQRVWRVQRQPWKKKRPERLEFIAETGTRP
jgi:hypothetical protein